ncbi:MAG: hypothetical protein LAO24_19970 [Acidobacteriia bacterium]|nr:hypothetical protein [Terriglobia bacterium]
MQTLQKLSGIAVLLLALHFTHVLHHVLVKMPHDNAWFWPGMALGVVVWAFSFIGGYLLLRSSR